MRALVLALALAATPALAAPLLHPVFADHAVLQRGAPIPVYGQAAPGTAVTVHLGSATATAKSGKDGTWQAVLPAMPAGGPYSLEAEGGGQHQVVPDVLLGDVFLCTGQSNMQMAVKGAANATAEIAAARDDQVRELTVGMTASAEPLSVFATPVAWKVESPQTAGEFSASCFFFARELRKHQRVPVGLMTVAWGGTRDRGWVSGPTLNTLGYYNDDLQMLALYRRDPEAASQRWDAAWEAWWHSQSDTSPWKESTSAWPLAPAALGAWGEWPALAAPEASAEPGVGFVGQMWLATHVTLTAAQAAQAATLELGRVVEEEKSWVNGVGIGGSSLAPNAAHPLPAGLLHAGDNSITLNIFCSWKNCGLSGPAATRALRLADGSAVLLDQPWRYQPVETRIAPQLPWGPMHGIGLQYNGMIAPIGPYGVKAAIWYQGESNIYFAQHYQQTLTAMMADWRKQFGAVPFVIVQIPDYGPAPTQPTQSLWSDIREAQRRTAAADGHAALVVTIDIGDPKLLHPTNKQEVGRRIAIAMRHLAYGEPVLSGPRPVAATRIGNTVSIAFRDVTGHLVATSGAPNAFELCDGTACHWAAARMVGNSVVLEGEGTRVRYCWGDSPVCTLSDATALPAAPFELPVP